MGQEPKKTIILYTDYYDDFAELSDKDAGVLIKNLLFYAKFGESPPNLKPELIGYFNIYKRQIEQNNEKWLDTKEKRRQSGRLGGLAKAAKNSDNSIANVANAKSAKQTVAKLANLAVNVNVNDNVNVNVNDISATNVADNSARAREGMSIDEMFYSFWDIYPKKLHQDEAKAMFTSVNPNITLFNTLVSAVKVWKTSEQWNKSNGRYIPSPAKWLRDKRWKDTPKQQQNSTFNVHSLGTHNTDMSDPSIAAYRNKVQAFLDKECQQDEN